MKRPMTSYLLMAMIALMSFPVLTKPGGPGYWQQISNERVYKVAVGWVAPNPEKPGSTTKPVIYATMKDGTYVYNGTPFSWTRIGSSFMKLVTHGNNLYGHDYSSRIPYKYSGTPNNWSAVGGPVFDIYAGAVGLFAIDAVTKDIYAYNSYLGGSFQSGWTKIGGPGTMFTVGSQHVYGLSPKSGNVFEFDFYTEAWTDIGGPWESICAGGPKIYGIWRAHEGPVYEYDHDSGQWRSLGRPSGTWVGQSTGDGFAVDPWKGDLYALGPNQYGVWILYTFSGSWGLKVWKKIGGRAGEIFPGWPTVLVTNKDTDELWIYVP